MRIGAYILIETVVGKTNEVTRALTAVEGVSAALTVTGPYDVVAVVDTVDAPTQDMVLRRIRRIPGVFRTVTCKTISAREPEAALSGVFGR